MEPLYVQTLIENNLVFALHRQCGLPSIEPDRLTIFMLFDEATKQHIPRVYCKLDEPGGEQILLLQGDGRDDPAAAMLNLLEFTGIVFAATESRSGPDGWSGVEPMPDTWRTAVSTFRQIRAQRMKELVGQKYPLNLGGT